MLSDGDIKRNIIEKEAHDRFRGYYLFDEDLEICKYMLDRVPYINVKSVITGDVISLNELKDISLEEMAIFGNDIYLRLKDIVSNTPISLEEDYFLKYRTVFGFDINNGDVNVRKVTFDKYCISRDTYDLSIFLLCHEHIHALKDTNYYECIDTLREVLPLFYELIVFDPDDKLSVEMIRVRMSWLLSNRNEYNIYNNLMKNKILMPGLSNTFEDCFARGGLYDYFRLKVGMYLSGFYYAMILYNLFKETPKKILDLVSKVLRKEITTFDMLYALDIYGDIRGDVFEREFSNIKRLIK